MKKKLTYQFVPLLILFLQLSSAYSQDINHSGLTTQGPLAYVYASVMDNNSWCKVNWNWNYSSLEIAYDDSEADDYFIFNGAGSLNAVKFTPPFNPCRVAGGKVFVGDGTFPGPFLGTYFRILVFDDDGEDGLPGTVLDSMTVTVNNYYWVEFDGLDAINSDGDFYLAMRQLSPSPGAAPVGIDTDNPTYNRSYVKYQDNPWALSPFQDFMIRAWVTGTEQDSTTYTIDRFSNFDPNGSPLLGDVTSLDTTNIHFYNDLAWDTLPEGWFAYGVRESYAGGGMSDYVISNIVGHFDSVPSGAPSCFYQADTGSMPLIICPPLDSTGNLPFNFLGYYIYLDGEEIDGLPPETTTYMPDGFTPCINNYGITAVYDLAPFGFPGEYGESAEIQTEFMIRYGYPLDFTEDWSSGNFTANNWTVGGENWSINGQVGSPSPSVEFTRDPVQIGYSIGLESYPLQADTLFTGQIYLDFLLKLDSYLATGDEMMLVQVWNCDSQTWNTAETLSNEDGSFGWLASHLDITSDALGEIFKIRFVATGENSMNIFSWYLDEIHVYRSCRAPYNLDVTINNNQSEAELTWVAPYEYDLQWISWDDGENYSAIGLGDQFDFDAAVRWDPVQLTQFPNSRLTRVAFFPTEATASYTIRVWTGPGAANLIVDQPVSSTSTGQWNYIALQDPVPIDTSQELWVGYHVSTVNGYPAGCDNGPAIDSYGNWLNFGGWQTLLQINPSWDYNWNIQALIEIMDTLTYPQLFAVYRRDSYPAGNYFLRGYTEDNNYQDDSIAFSGFLCYKVSALYFQENDTCESGFSEELCQYLEGIEDKEDQTSFKIYPNPARDLLSIESSEIMSVLSLYTYDGRLIFRKEINDRNYTLPVGNYPEGVYLLRVEIGNEVLSRKVVILR